MPSFDSFAGLARFMAAEQNAADVQAAANLKRSAPLRRTRARGTGPAVARTTR